MANTNNGAPAKQRVSFSEYVKSVRKELSKVVWPNRQELGAYTVVVLATCAAFAIGFWLVDTGVLAALKGILGITLN